MKFAVPLAFKGLHKQGNTVIYTLMCVKSICMRQNERWKTCALMTAILYLRYTGYITVNLYTCIDNIILYKDVCVCLCLVSRRLLATNIHTYTCDLPHSLALLLKFLACKWCGLAFGAPYTLKKSMCNLQFVASKVSCTLCVC